jgi:hypothetical protein
MKKDRKGTLELFIDLLSCVGDMGWIGGGNIAELELELIKDRCRGPCGRDGAVPDVAPSRQGIQERLCLF